MALIVTPGTYFKRANFYLQLSGMLTSGIPIIQALELLKKNPPSRSYIQPIDHTIHRLQMGSTFVEALTATGRWLPEFDLALISAGETSGRLDSSLRILGNHYTDRATTFRNIVFSMLYPIFLIHLALLIFPTTYLSGLFLGGGVQRMITQKLTTFITLWTAFLLLMALLNAPFGRAWRSLLGAIGNIVPVLGGARKSHSLAMFSAALEALISAGVTVIEAWRIAAQASASPAILKAVNSAIPNIQAGVMPGEAIQEYSVFPPAFRSAYATGEVSGQLDTALARLHTLYNEEAKIKFQNFGKAAPVVVFLFIGIAIGYQVITFWMNYYGQLDKIMQ